MEGGIIITDNYWDKKLANKDSPRQPIINGNCYYIGDEDEVDKGMNGMPHKIKFKDNRVDNLVIYTTNLWLNGEIPVHYRESLEDNAEFYKG